MGAVLLPTDRSGETGSNTVMRASGAVHEYKRKMPFDGKKS